MSFKIYTKTGDKGLTGLIGGTKVSKSNLQIEAYGSVDELNAQLGLCNDLLATVQIHQILHVVQNKLFTVGSILATSTETNKTIQLPSIHDEDIQLLEIEIDKMEGTLPELKNFILPGGHIIVSQLHISRCVCRRAERACVRLQEEKNFVFANVLIYLNRLSDYLFVLSRYVAYQLKCAEIIWKSH